MRARVRMRVGMVADIRRLRPRNVENNPVYRIVTPPGGSLRRLPTRAFPVFARRARQVPKKAADPTGPTASP